MSRFSRCFAPATFFSFLPFLLVAMVLAGPSPVRAMGSATLPALSGQASPSGPITVWYPSDAPETSSKRGPFVLSAAWDGAPRRGNGGLIILSHGSGGSASMYHDLARVLVEAGFVVAAPEHQGDNWRDQTKTGPDSWKLRPAEVSSAINRIQGEPRFAPLVNRGQVGVYGMSAGGLTALEFAGATWSLSRLVKHCAEHLEEDAGFCAFREMIAGKLDREMMGRLKTQFIEGAKSGLVDSREYGHQDSRVQAVVAAVPVAAVIDPATLRTFGASTGLISADKDQVLAPRWHVLTVEATCSSCTALGTVQGGGHLSILSPLPEEIVRGLGLWAKDPAGFDRSSLTAIYNSIAGFFAGRLSP
jgi:predicted dienelactone hydrolase